MAVTGDQDSPYVRTDRISGGVTNRSAPPGGWPTPSSAYVHVPFCRHRCGYCNFSVVAGRDDLIDRYLSAIDRELDSLHRPSVQTVYVGGGTPTHLPEKQLARFLTLIRDRFDFDVDGEWSIEANPEDITPEKLDLMVDHGVNRLSLGVQSFEDSKLHVLERGHTGTTARQRIELAASRIANVSIDLIFAAPGETVQGWLQDLTTALALPVQHLSTYMLTFEKGTSFWSRLQRGDLNPLAESTEVTMYDVARELTAAAGWQHYEISNFAAPNFQCRHNVAYWEGRGWYAAGPGAARFVAGKRELNHRSTTTYLRRIESGQDATAERESIGVEQYARERAAFGIRMLAGIDLGELKTETGIAIANLCREEITLCVAEGLLQNADGDHWRLTERGVLFADTVASRLLG